MYELTVTHILSHIVGNDSVYYRWYFKPPNGTFIPLTDSEKNELIVKKPSMADHGYYLCQAYNYKGSAQSRIAKLYILRTSIVQLSVMANFSINWFALDSNEDEGSGRQRINVTDCNIITSALESALNSSNIKIELISVDNRPGGSEVKTKIFGVCSRCNLLNRSLNATEYHVMNLFDEFSNLTEFLNHGIVNSEFDVRASSIRMEVVMATAGKKSHSCPHTMSKSNNHNFICGECPTHSYCLDCIVISIYTN